MEDAPWSKCAKHAAIINPYSTGSRQISMQARFLLTWWPIHRGIWCKYELHSMKQYCAFSDLRVLLIHYNIVISKGWHENISLDPIIRDRITTIYIILISYSLTISWYRQTAGGERKRSNGTRYIVKYKNIWI